MEMGRDGDGEGERERDVQCDNCSLLHKDNLNNELLFTCSIYYNLENQ